MKKADQQKLIKEVEERARFFQQVQVWPLMSKLNYQGWMSNFKTHEEKFFASLLLDFFIYYSEAMVDKLLSHSVGATGKAIEAKKKCRWLDSDFKTSSYYSWVSGEQPSWTDSGLVFVRKARQVLKIPKKRILSPEELVCKLEDLKTESVVILLDDFLGSGNQCKDTWEREYKVKKGTKTFSDIASEGKHMFTYSPLMANQMGYTKIINECPGLHLSTAHVLGDEYSLFNDQCPCWSDINAQEGIDFITTKSREIGIVYNYGADVDDLMGFCCQGLAIAFSHSMPDATIPLFYWEQNGWTPLFKRS